MSISIPLSEAESQLAELVRRAEAGEDVVLTRHGHEAVRLVPVRRRPTPAEKRAVIAAAQVEAATTLRPGPSAARSQDFLYDGEGLPT